MHRPPSWPLAAILALVLAGCAAPSLKPEGSVTVNPGDVFAFDGAHYRIEYLGEDFVFRREVEAGGEKGEVSGWVDEVFRVGRHQLSQGQWHMHPRLTGVYLQWMGGETFTLSRKAPGAFHSLQ
jgi:hypothetical protein